MKQLASWLKEADKATGLLELSIAGLVFMAATHRVGGKTEDSSCSKIDVISI